MSPKTREFIKFCNLVLEGKGFKGGHIRGVYWAINTDNQIIGLDQGDENWIWAYANKSEDLPKRVIRLEYRLISSTSHQLRRELPLIHQFAVSQNYSDGYSFQEFPGHLFTLDPQFTFGIE